MRRLLYVVIFIILVTSALAQRQGKVESRYGFEIDRKPSIFYNAYFTFPGAGWDARLNFIISLQNDILQFTKVEDVYTAAYEVTIVIRNMEKDSVYLSEIWEESVAESLFTQTNSKKTYQKSYRQMHQQFIPGNYKISVEVMDKGTGRGFRNSRDLYLKDYKQAGLNHSPLLFVSAEDSLSAEIILRERGTILEFNSPVITHVMLETLQKSEIKVSYQLVRFNDDSKSTVTEHNYSIPVTGGKTAIYEEMPRTLMEEGSYLLTYTIEYGGSKKEFTKKFEIVWFDKPVYLYEPDLAVRPLNYILSEAEQEQVDDMSYDEMTSWFWTFWKKKDPSQDTPYNEILYEFYTRVDEANTRFSQRFLEGWETDRGKALILYGVPDREESNRYAISGDPYEIWYYNAINRKLTFLDVNRDDNYVLVAVEDIDNTEEKTDE